MGIILYGQVMQLKLSDANKKGEGCNNLGRIITIIVLWVLYITAVVIVLFVKGKDEKLYCLALIILSLPIHVIGYLRLRMITRDWKKKMSEEVRS